MRGLFFVSNLQNYAFALRYLLGLKMYIEEMWILFILTVTCPYNPTKFDMNNLSQIRIFLEKFPNAQNAIQVLDTQWSEDQNQIEEVQEDNMEVDSDNASDEEEEEDEDEVEDSNSDEQSDAEESDSDSVTEESEAMSEIIKINILIMFKKYDVACALAR